MNTNATAILRVIDRGIGASIQDAGRPGWRRFGVPIGGCMDEHAAECANRLVDNKWLAPVVEILLGGIRFEMLESAWIAVTGATVEASIPTWRAHYAQAGETISLRHSSVGVWIYLAVDGGLAAPMIFGSTSYYARGNLGTKITKELLLSRGRGKRMTLPGGVSGRAASWPDRRDYSNPPVIRVWTGPQWKNFSMADRETFLTADWTVSSESDRVGYRLQGPTLRANPAEIVSEPVRMGSIQVPEGGQPIVMMRDGPTVGGYPKIALVDDDDLPWVAQCRAGQRIKFRLVS